MRLKTNWHSYYAAHCDKCKWTGSSEYVIGDFEGPFYCPFCYHSDPTETESKFFTVDSPIYSVKEFCLYVIYRAFSLATQHVRYIYSKYKDYKLKKWYESSN